MLKEFNKRIKCLYLGLINTGERPILEKKFEDIIPDHQFAYRFASRYIDGKTVLDFGCGGGYGTEFLSRFTKKIVTGFDVDSKTIRIAKKFFKKQNLYFIDNKENIKKYNVITMFQVIEHLGKYLPETLQNISKKYLEKNGFFICSTPNKLVTSPGLKKPIMVFHEFEFTPSTLQKTLKNYFSKVKIYGQLEINPKIDKSISSRVRKKITRILSQIEIIRIIARYLPIKFKYLLMGNLIKNTRQYKLATTEEEIKKSFTLITLCQN